MKKLLAILMALTVCGAVAYSACAEETADLGEAPAVTETTTESASDMIRELANDPNAVALAEKIDNALKNGATKDDITALLGTLGEYVNGKGFEVADLQDGGAFNEVLLGFLDDAGINTEELDKAIADSTIAKKALELYYKPTEAETTTVPSTEPEPTTEPTYSNPDTGAF